MYSAAVQEVLQRRLRALTNWVSSSKLILLELHEKLLKNSALTTQWSTSIWSKLERWKNLISGCLMSLPDIQKKKNVTLKCCLPLFYTTVCNVGDQGSIPGLGRSSEGGHGNPLQYSCLKNPHGQRILAGCSPWGRKESDTTKQLSIA